MSKTMSDMKRYIKVRGADERKEQRWVPILTVQRNKYCLEHVKSVQYA